MPRSVLDSDGNRLLTAGIWRSDLTPDVSVQGGQGMHFVVSNANVLGVSLTITANTNESHSLNILPFGSGDFNFSTFGREPMGWTFTPSIDGDGAVVSWNLFSTWIEGDDPNG